MVRLVTILLFLLILTDTRAQVQSDEQLATQYFANKEYDKASDLYTRLIIRNPGSVYIYDNLLQCYLQLRQFDDAEKMIKKQQRRFPENDFFRVDLGYVYKAAGNAEKSVKYYQDIIKNLKGTESQTISLTNAFRKRNELDMAISVYLKSRQINRSSTLFAIPLAQLYAEKRDTRAMIEEYLNAIQANPDLTEDVEDYLQLYLEQQGDYEQLKAAVLKKDRDFPGNPVFSELLIWICVQRQDFDAAFMQAKALEKRNKGDGRRILDLANLAVSNGAYASAIGMFTYIMQLGKDKPLWLNARIGIMDARNKQVTRTGIYNQTDLLQLEKEYEAFLADEGRNDFTASAIRDMARLEALYLNNTTKGISLYKELIEMPRLDARVRANCKLELGDLYVLSGEVWDAVLLYGQVDKDFLEDPLGQEAKLKNARLSYYIGEFEWARSQLDVLKTATSQLIANDALELSLLIQDNTVDSNDDPLLVFARADLNFYQRHYDEALRLLDSINLAWPRHTLDDEVLFKRAQIALVRKDYNQAIKWLDQLLTEHGTDILGDNALFMKADITEKYLGNNAAALKLYESFIDTYPGSFFLTEVRRRFRNLRGDKLE